MKDELEGAMRLIGITSLDQAGPEFVNTSDIDHLVPDSVDHPYAKRVARGHKHSNTSANMWSTTKAKL